MHYNVHASFVGNGIVREILSQIISSHGLTSDRCENCGTLALVMKLSNDST